MNHSFIPSGFDSNTCVICKKNQISHTNSAECECCNNIGSVNLMYGSMLVCADCEAKEIAAQKANMTVETQEQRVLDARITLDKNHKISKIMQSIQIDNSVTIRTDLFNAPTVAIVELEKLVNEDESITNKPYALAQLLLDRFNHHKDVIFEKTKEIVELGNEQRAIQVYLNNLANKLRVEEREKLRIADISYKPQAIKPIKDISQGIKTRKPRGIDKAELTKYATELGVSEFTLQMLVVSKGITVETAANLLRRNINETKSLD